MTAKSIHTNRYLDAKGRSMPRLARSLGWLVAVALLACVCRPSRADDYQRYPPQPSAGAWPDRPIEVTADARSHWPAGSSAPAGGAPRTLPAAYQAPNNPLPPGGTSAARPLGVESSGSPRPIPLSRGDSDSLKSLGGFVGADMPPFVNAAASLGLVLGLFLAVVWAVRRGMPKGSGLLPIEAVEVLGRAPLLGRQQVYLVRCGNKIVLLNVTPGGVETLTEISDPAEVDRLHSICQPQGSTGGSLGQWLGHLTAQPRSAEHFARGETDSLDFGHLDAGGQHRA